MKQHNYSTSFILLLLVGMACSQSTSEIQRDVELNTLIDSASYVIGFQTGEQITMQGFEEIKPDKYIGGFIEAVEKGENKISRLEINQLFARLNEFLIDRELTENSEEQKIFFDANREKADVIETASGLQYKIVREGDGEKPTAESKVQVMYEGRLIDGTVFDGNYSKGEPTEFVVGQVIAGWVEGLQLMKIGSEFEFYIPSDLAYGKNPRPGGVIKPGDALIFKVELLDIIK